MKRIFLFAIITMIGAVSCSSDNNGTDVDVVKVSLNKPTLTMVVGAEYNLIATIDPSNATVQTVNWSSSAPSIATVSEYGKVKALAIGTTTITANASGKTTTSVVTVTAAEIPVESLTMSEIEIALQKGATKQLTATITPTNATDQNIVWLSSVPAAATVVDGLVTALAQGVTTISATAGGKSVTCNVKVSEDAVITFLYQEMELGMDQVNIWVEYQTTPQSTPELTAWTSSDPSIVEVNQNYPLLTPKAVGEATITATMTKGGTASILVKVIPKATRVYNVGYEFGIKNQPMSWVYKFFTPLDSTDLLDGSGNSIAVSGNYVYIAGNLISGGVEHAISWKNIGSKETGVVVEYTELTTGAVESSANSIAVSGTDVYIAGSITVNGFPTAVLWKNGVATTLSTKPGYPCRAYSVAVDGTDIYVVGHQGSETYLWKNSDAAVLISDPLSDIGSSFVTVVGGKVYIAYMELLSGIFNTYLRIDGVKTNVTNNTSGSNKFFLEGLFVAGTDVYLSGYNVNGTITTAVYYKNGVMTTLPNGYKAGGIFVTSTGDVYVSGSQGIGPKNTACYWKNGVVTPLHPIYMGKPGFGHSKAIFVDYHL